MKVAILDDWFDTLRGLECFALLADQEVTVFNDHVEDTDLLAQRLADFDALVLIRERTPIRAALLEREEWELQFTDIFEQINAFVTGAPVNVINPQVLA